MHKSVLINLMAAVIDVQQGKRSNAIARLEAVASNPDCLTALGEMFPDVAVFQATAAAKGAKGAKGAPVAAKPKEKPKAEPENKEFWNDLPDIDYRDNAHTTSSELPIESLASFSSRPGVGMEANLESVATSFPDFLDDPLRNAWRYGPEGDLPTPAQDVVSPAFDYDYNAPDGLGLLVEPDDNVLPTDLDSALVPIEHDDIIPVEPDGNLSVEPDEPVQNGTLSIRIPSSGITVELETSFSPSR